MFLSIPLRINLNSRMLPRTIKSTTKSMQCLRNNWFFSLKGEKVLIVEATSLRNRQIFQYQKQMILQTLKKKKKNCIKELQRNLILAREEVGRGKKTSCSSTGLFILPRRVLQALKDTICNLKRTGSHGRGSINHLSSRAASKRKSKMPSMKLRKSRKKMRNGFR